LVELNLTHWPNEQERHLKLAEHFVLGYEQLFMLMDGEPYSPDCRFGCYRCQNVNCILNQPVSSHSILSAYIYNYCIKVWAAILQQIAALTDDQQEQLRSYRGQRWSGPFGVFESQPIGFPVQQSLSIIRNKSILKNFDKATGTYT